MWPYFEYSTSTRTPQTACMQSALVFMRVRDTHMHARLDSVRNSIYAHTHRQQVVQASTRDGAANTHPSCAWPLPSSWRPLPFSSWRPPWCRWPAAAGPRQRQGRGSSDGTSSLAVVWHWCNWRRRSAAYDQKAVLRKTNTALLLCSCMRIIVSHIRCRRVSCQMHSYMHTKHSETTSPSAVYCLVKHAGILHIWQPT